MITNRLAKDQLQDLIAINAKRGQNLKAIKRPLSPKDWVTCIGLLPRATAHLYLQHITQIKKLKTTYHYVILNKSYLKLLSSFRRTLHSKIIQNQTSLDGLRILGCSNDRIFIF